jgi:hypothetical protein
VKTFDPFDAIDELMTVNQIRKLHNVHETRILMAVKEGELESRKFAGRLVFRKADVLKWKPEDRRKGRGRGRRKSFEERKKLYTDLLAEGRGDVLTERRASCLKSYFMDGKTYDQIAQEAECSRQAVQVLVSSGIAAMELKEMREEAK